MKREEVIQAFVALYNRPSYLEIGVQHGITFDTIEAGLKVAVDPDFLFDVADAAIQPNNRTALYHEVPSDAYFGAHHPVDRFFDIVFIDGLHSFEQTLRDLLNAIECLAPGGIILIDDVMPISYAASLPTLEENIAFRAAKGMRTVDWMGDVYKLVFFLRDYLPAFRYATVEDTHGQTVMWRDRRPQAPAPLAIEAISRLSYRDAVIGRDAFNFRPCESILADVRAWRATVSAVVSAPSP